MIVRKQVVIGFLLALAVGCGSQPGQRDTPLGPFTPEQLGEQFLAVLQDPVSDRIHSFTPTREEFNAWIARMQAAATSDKDHADIEDLQADVDRLLVREERTLDEFHARNKDGIVLDGQSAGERVGDWSKTVFVVALSDYLPESPRINRISGVDVHRFGTLVAFFGLDEALFVLVLDDGMRIDESWYLTDARPKIVPADELDGMPLRVARERLQLQDDATASRLLDLLPGE